MFRTIGWIGLILVYSTKFVNSFISNYLLYGKLTKNAEHEKKNIIMYFLNEITIPNGIYWKLMYFYSIILWFTLIFKFNRPITLISILFFIQLCRRLYETLYVHSFSKRPLKVPLACSGLLFYTMATCTTTFFEPGSLTWTNFISRTVACAMFATFSAIQTQSHLILADLRSPSNRKHDEDNNVYKIPKGGLFEFVSCPHYCAEVLIYFSMVYAALESKPVEILNMFLMLCFVTLNLCSNAVETHEWYLKKFGKEYRDLKRYAIFSRLL